MKEILRKFKELLWNCPAFDASDAPADGYRDYSDSLICGEKGCYWKDLDYTDKTVSTWRCRPHLGRIRESLCAIGQDNAIRGEERTDRLISALEFWIDTDPINPNWWHNAIGVPSALCDILILAGQLLDEEYFQRALHICERGSLSGTPAIDGWTGANLIWGIRNSIAYALLTDNPELLCRASKRAEAELIIADGDAEGIKEDGSFYQHGPLLYSGGYGMSFTLDMAQLAYILSGSEYEFNSDALDVLCLHVLDGQRVMTRGAAIDYLTVGREIVRPGGCSSAPFRSALMLMLETPEMPRKSELQGFLLQLDCPEASPAGFKFFYKSLLLTAVTPDFYMSVKGADADFVGTEAGNGENFLGINLARGGNTVFMQDGREYTDFDPFADHTLLPGTTAPDETDEELGSGWRSWLNIRGEKSVCRGYADNNCGIMAFDPDFRGVRGKALYVLDRGGLVAIGCDFHCEREGVYVLRTSVEQCFLRDNCTVSGEGVLSEGESVTNGRFIYTNLCGLPLHYYAGEASGSFSRNDKFTARTETLTAGVLRLYYEHSETGNYAYSVAPVTASVRRIEYMNTPELQAVLYENGGTAAVFRRPGELVLPDGQKLQSSGGIVSVRV